MKTKVETLEGNQVKISFEIDAKEVDARIARTYKDFAKRYNFPGFRPGKAPRPVIDNMLGAEAVRATVTETLVNDVYPKALDEHNLVPLYKAENDFESDMVEAGKPFKFTSTIQVKPEYELSSYDPVDVEIPSVEPTETEIDQQVEELRNYYHDFKDAPANTKVKDGEFVEFTMKVTDNKGEDVPNMSAENRMYQLGVNLFPKAFDAELIGMKKGDSKSFDIDFTNDDSMMAQTMEDKGVYHFDVTIDVVKTKVLPEVTDEWVKLTFGFESIADMREKVGQSIKDQKSQSAPRRTENECLYAISQRITDDIPESMCEVEEANLLQAFYGQLNRANMTFDQYLDTMGIDAEQFKQDMKKQSQDLVKQDLALDAWARHYNITATDEDISAEFAKAEVDDPVATEKEWRENGRIPMIREGVIRTKAMLDIVDKAHVTEKTLEEKQAEAKGSKAQASAKPATKKAATKADDTKAEKSEKPAAKTTDKADKKEKPAAKTKKKESTKTASKTAKKTTKKADSTKKTDAKKSTSKKSDK